MKNKLFLLIMMSLLISSCDFFARNNEEFRDKILFNDSLQQVEDSIANLISYFDRIRK